MVAGDAVVRERRPGYGLIGGALAMLGRHHPVVQGGNRDRFALRPPAQPHLVDAADDGASLPAKHEIAATLARHGVVVVEPTKVALGRLIGGGPVLAASERGVRVEHRLVIWLDTQWFHEVG